jgi:3-carboxy-cis,cis-muconate cycloisomerase
MTDLFWPGDNRAGDLMSDAAFLAAMVQVENAWLGVLVDAGVAPVEARADLTSLVSTRDVEAIAAGAEADGNPVIGLLALLRERADGQAARWLHRGLTSQDVIDTAMMLCLRDALARVRREIDTQVRTLATLAETHQHDPMLARTLAQPALAGTVGLKMATWLSVCWTLSMPSLRCRRYRCRPAGPRAPWRPPPNWPDHRTRPSHCPMRWRMHRGWPSPPLGTPRGR